MTKGIDWASAPADYPIWVESNLGCEPSGWHCLDEKGNFRDGNGEIWQPWQVAAGECVPHYKPEWGGEGLPPVGINIEFLGFQGGVEEWKKGRVVAHDNGFAVIGYLTANYFAVESDKIRPIRTAEQIAKAQRSKACDEIYGVLCSPGIRPSNRSDMAEALYDAGYRKQVAP